MTFVVAQLGARMHYAVPRMLAEAGRLERLFTDFCGTHPLLRLLAGLPRGLQPTVLQRAAGRTPPGVPAARITQFATFGVDYALRRRRARGPSDSTAAFLWAGETFGGLVARSNWGDAEGVYVFNSAGLEILTRARSEGRRGIVEQTMAPYRLAHDLTAEEQERFPAWATDLDRRADAFAEREAQEWQLADTIVCGSAFVRDGLAACGGPAERCVVVPYGVDNRFTLPPRPPHEGPLRVLVLGSVGLRKGSPYAVAAAKRLRGLAEVRLVGPLEPGAQRAADGLRRAVDLVGPVPRQQVAEHLAWADVFLLPSLCEGSATVVYEALAASLPVVCTPNTGSVVRDGHDGFIVPVRDVEAIVAAIERLAGDAELRRVMAENAAATAARHGIADYRRRLLTALSDGAEPQASYGGGGGRVTA